MSNHPLPHDFHTRFKSFEDYLDSLVIEDDQKFLKDVDTARVIAQLGYRSVRCSFPKCVYLDILDANRYSRFWIFWMQMTKGCDIQMSSSFAQIFK